MKNSESHRSFYIDNSVLKNLMCLVHYSYYSGVAQW